MSVIFVCVIQGRKWGGGASGGVGGGVWVSGEGLGKRRTIVLPSLYFFEFYWNLDGSDRRAKRGKSSNQLGLTSLRRIRLMEKTHGNSVEERGGDGV